MADATRFAMQRTWENPPAPKSQRLLSTISNNKSWVVQQLKTGIYFWRRYTRHHMWRRQRHESSLRFSNWLKKSAYFKRMRCVSPDAAGAPSPFANASMLTPVELYAGLTAICATRSHRRSAWSS